MKQLKFLILVVALGVSIPSATPACSLAPGYLPPSNFELVRDTPVIVLAKVVKLVENGRSFSTFEFEVVTVLKGEMKDKMLTMMGSEDWKGGGKAEDFSGPRRGAYSGSCNAYDYQADQHFVLFLTRTGGKRWDVSGPPFSRINEDVSGPDAPWVKAVTHYVRISGLETVALRKAALRELAAQAENPVPGLAADIRRHFAMPHTSKPFEDLQQIYDETRNEGIRSNVLWAFAQGKQTAAVGLICDLVRSGGLLRHSSPIASYVKETRSASVSEAILKAHDSWKDKLHPHQRRELLEALAAAADASFAPMMMEYLKVASFEDLTPLQRFFVRHPDPAATAEFARRLNGDYGHSAVLAFALAAMGDKEVLAWALKPERQNDLLWIASAVIACSPLPEAEQAAQGILKGPDPKRIAELLRGYRYSRSPERVRRLLQGFALRAGDPDLDPIVRGVLQELAQEGDSEALEALKKLPLRTEK